MREGPKKRFRNTVTCPGISEMPGLACFPAKWLSSIPRTRRVDELLRRAPHEPRNHWKFHRFVNSAEVQRNRQIGNFDGLLQPAHAPLGPLARRVPRPERDNGFV